MKRVNLILVIAFFVFATTAGMMQRLRWLDGTPQAGSTAIYTQHDVGIGTTDPQEALDLASGNLTTTGTITSGDITIFEATPILVFRDSNSLGAASVGFIEWRDSGGGRAGFLGNNTSGNDDLYWKNEQGGNIGIETTGGGEVQIFAKLQMENDRLIAVDVNAGLTASTTQEQGQGALTAQVNEIATCVNVNDTVTLPTAVAGLKTVVINNGAQTLQIFPASGDNLGAGVDTSTTLASGSNVQYVSYDNTNWESI